METKDTLPLCLDSEEQQMQQIQDKAKRVACFQMFIKSQIYLDDEYVIMTRNYFLEYTQLEILEFRDTLIQQIESVKKSIDKRALHKREYDSWVNERQMQTTEEKVDTSKALDASLVDTKSSGQNQKSRIQTVDQEMMHMLVMQISDPYMMKSQWPRMEAHCVNLELKYQNQALKEGQHGQFLNVKSNEAKVKHDIDVIETINIELEHKVAKLLKENESLKKHYKELSDSIKTTRAKTIEHTTSLIAKNTEFKAQL
ncbi:hypothetical protein Tco_0706275 [Tanacetum coccineum]|uniref:Uncharacterized protein n=1 Tax=Tanacetum coccineum TaxID=301880 RepID=A0ABQ4Y6X9_9ASTR